jgi:polar amino acid transport system permease protein
MTHATTTIAAAPPPPEVRRKASLTHWLGLGLIGLWIALGLGIAALLVFGYDPEVYARYLPRVLLGVWTTVQLVVLSLIFGALLSIPIAFGRLRGRGAWAAFCFGYSYFFRGTPLLAQTFLVYYGSGQFSGFFKDIGLWWMFREAFFCAVLTFSLNTAAYQAEILAGAIRSVPRGQWQAADALGLSRRATMLKVILPQALITSLRPYGNEVVLMIKGSAVAAIITVLDLMGQTRFAFSKTYDMQVYLWAAILYLVMVEALRRIWDRLELRLTRHLKR